MTLATDVDATFFKLIHQLREAKGDDGGVEQRHAERLPFRSMQRIAPLLAPGVPAESAFFDVRCVDLNRRGFAFLLPEPPEFSRLVVSLGQPPQELLISARVAHTERVTVDAAGRVQRPSEVANGAVLAGESAILVGCQFLQRLTRSRPQH